MAREKMFNFFPVKEEKFIVPDKQLEPYVRIQNPGLMIFPRTTLEHFEIKLGDVVYMQFFADYDKRALGFKFVTKFTPEQVKEFKVLKIKQYKRSGMQGMVSIKKILNHFKEWETPIRCTLEKYTDKDEMMSWIGEVNYIIIPRPKSPDDPKAARAKIDGPIVCLECQKECRNLRSLSQHKRQNHS
jgi:hypothetical protein